MQFVSTSSLLSPDQDPVESWRKSFMRPDTRTLCSVGLSLARHPEEALETVLLQEIENTLFLSAKFNKNWCGAHFKVFEIGTT